MAGQSVIHYKFRPSNATSSIHFDGHGIRVFDVKSAIVKERKMERGLDFDLHISNDQSGEGKYYHAFIRLIYLLFYLSFVFKVVFLEPDTLLLCAVVAAVYDDENALIPKNTALVVKRVAATAHGPGLLARLAANTPLSKSHMYSIVRNLVFAISSYVSRYCSSMSIDFQVEFLWTYWIEISPINKYAARVFSSVVDCFDDLMGGGACVGHDRHYPRGQELFLPPFPLSFSLYQFSLWEDGVGPPHY